MSDLAGTPVWTTEELKWHKSCYSTFTSVIALNRLRKRFNLSASTSGASGSKTDTNQPRPHRQTLQANFELCIFCQSSNTSGMRNVATMKLSDRLMESAKLDTVMGIRLANVVDLVAAEGKYHLKCLVQFERKIEKL